MWTGYSLGSALVQSYLEQHPDVAAADLAVVEADEIVRDAAFCE